MELIDYLRRQFAYDAWANKEVLRAMEAGDKKIPRALSLMNHILSAERLWLERLTEVPQSFPVWPDFDLAQCARLADELAGLWSKYLKGMSMGALMQPISYKNTKGEMWTDSVHDVLTHVVMHSAYHRAQVAAAMRANGMTPVMTDFIHAVRRKLIE